MAKYDFTAIEKKWRKYWDDNRTFHAEIDKSRPKFYALVEFPYPSGQGLHAGHPRPYTAMDIISRKRRLQGYNVLFPMGWDAFGLPTENYAIKNKVHPAFVTENNIRNFKKQIKSLGLSIDWEREINTTDPGYYHWTQWIFLQLWKRGLAYKKEMAVNWCTECKVGLANEEVVNGVCERCHGIVIRKVKSQWMLKITEYAARLIDEIGGVDYPERIKTSQINWIGRSEGAEIDFPTTAGDILRVYTTRPDTIFGATYMVIAPEHHLIEKWSDKLVNIKDLRGYREKAARKSDFERAEIVKDKTGVKLEGLYAVNPVNGLEIPVFVSDYVLMTYGAGAIMAVPAHDDRDLEFAKLFNLPVTEVVKNADNNNSNSGEVIINSDFLNGLCVSEAKERIKNWLERENKGRRKINYKLRDWLFSRQRYWGEPIPLIYCEKCGWVAVPENELPLKLPEVENYAPTDNGSSPLEDIPEFVNAACPECGGAAKRETDTMPQWAGSSWYYLRYADPGNNTELISKDALRYWMPVDWYNGGMEHTTLHLLYSRFWHKFLYDIGCVNTSEPYLKRTAHGMILGEDGEKMSKSRGNVINPNEIIDEYGADALRLYEMFIGDFEKTATWSSKSIKGCKRFLERVWGLRDILVDDEKSELSPIFHKSIKKVGDDIEAMKFNTAIAAMMSLINQIYENNKINYSELKAFLIMLNPFAPHLTSEMYESLAFGLIHEAEWVKYNPELCIDDTVEIALQVNGKVRARITMTLNDGTDKNILLETAKSNSVINNLIQEKRIIKQIVIPKKLVNIVTGLGNKNDDAS